jgi:hypothetical protein
MKIKTLYTYCEQVGRRGKEYEKIKQLKNSRTNSTKEGNKNIQGLNPVQYEAACIGK